LCAIWNRRPSLATKTINLPLGASRWRTRPDKLSRAKFRINTNISNAARPNVHISKAIFNYVFVLRRVCGKCLAEVISAILRHHHFRETLANNLKNQHLTFRRRMATICPKRRLAPKFALHLRHPQPSSQRDCCGDGLALKSQIWKTYFCHFRKSHFGSCWLRPCLRTALLLLLEHWSRWKAFGFCQGVDLNANRGGCLL